MHLVESISVAMELLGNVFSIQAAKTLLKGESAEMRFTSLYRIPDVESSTKCPVDLPLHLPTWKEDVIKPDM
jgi:hypothetical protein